MFVLFFLLSLLAQTSAKRSPAVSTGDLVTRRLIYPVAEAAELGVHKATLWDRQRKGKIELIRVGGKTYVRADELARYIAEESGPLDLAVGERLAVAREAAHLEDRAG